MCSMLVKRLYGVQLYSFWCVCRCLVWLWVVWLALGRSGTLWDALGVSLVVWWSCGRVSALVGLVGVQCRRALESIKKD